MRVREERVREERLDGRLVTWDDTSRHPGALVDRYDARVDDRQLARARLVFSAVRVSRRCSARVGRFRLAMIDAADPRVARQIAQKRRAAHGARPRRERRRRRRVGPRVSGRRPAPGNVAAMGLGRTDARRAPALGAVRRRGPPRRLRDPLRRPLSTPDGDGAPRRSPRRRELFNRTDVDRRPGWAARRIARRSDSALVHLAPRSRRNVRLAPRARDPYWGTPPICARRLAGLDAPFRSADGAT